MEITSCVEKVLSAIILIYDPFDFALHQTVRGFAQGHSECNRTMSNGGVLADPLGKVGDLGKQVSKGAVVEAAKVEKTAKQQVVGLENQGEIDSKNTNNVQNQAPNIPSSIDTVEIVKKMYEASSTKTKAPPDKIISAVIEENPKKTPEEIQKLAATRQQLWQQQHMSTYFDPTFNRPPRQEERPADKIEKEEKEKKQMEALELQKQEKKKEELSPAVKQGTHEKYPGASG